MLTLKKFVKNFYKVKIKTIISITLILILIALFCMILKRLTFKKEGFQEQEPFDYIAYTHKYKNLRRRFHNIDPKNPTDRLIHLKKNQGPFNIRKQKFLSESALVSDLGWMGYDYFSPYGDNMKIYIKETKNGKVTFKETDIDIKKALTTDGLDKSIHSKFYIKAENVVRVLNNKNKVVEHEYLNLNKSAVLLRFYHTSKQKYSDFSKNVNLEELKKKGEINAGDKKADIERYIKNARSVQKLIDDILSLFKKKDNEFLSEAHKNIYDFVEKREEINNFTTSDRKPLYIQEKNWIDEKINLIKKYLRQNKKSTTITEKPSLKVIKSGGGFKDLTGDIGNKDKIYEGPVEGTFFDELEPDTEFPFNTFYTRSSKWIELDANGVRKLDAEGNPSGWFIYFNGSARQWIVMFGKGHDMKTPYRTKKGSHNHINSLLTDFDGNPSVGLEPTPKFKLSLNERPIRKTEDKPEDKPEDSSIYLYDNIFRIFLKKGDEKLYLGTEDSFKKGKQSRTEKIEGKKEFDKFKSLLFRFVKFDSEDKYYFTVVDNKGNILKYKDSKKNNFLRFFGDDIFFSGNKPEELPSHCSKEQREKPKPENETEISCSGFYPLNKEMQFLDTQAITNIIKPGRKYETINETLNEILGGGPHPIQIEFAKKMIINRLEDRCDYIEYVHIDEGLRRVFHAKPKNNNFGVWTKKPRNPNEFRWEGYRKASIYPHINVPDIISTKIGTPYKNSSALGNYWRFGRKSDPPRKCYLDERINDDDPDKFENLTEIISDAREVQNAIDLVMKLNDNLLDADENLDLVIKEINKVINKITNSEYTETIIKVDEKFLDKINENKNATIFIPYGHELEFLKKELKEFNEKPKTEEEKQAFERARLLEEKKKAEEEARKAKEEEINNKATKIVKDVDDLLKKQKDQENNFNKAVNINDKNQFYSKVKSLFDEIKVKQTELTNLDPENNFELKIPKEKMDESVKGAAGRAEKVKKQLKTDTQALITIADNTSLELSQILKKSLEKNQNTEKFFTEKLDELNNISLDKNTVLIMTNRLTNVVNIENDIETKIQNINFPDSAEEDKKKIDENIAKYENNLDFNIHSTFAEFEKKKLELETLKKKSKDELNQFTNITENIKKIIENIKTICTQKKEKLKLLIEQQKEIELNAKCGLGGFTNAQLEQQRNRNKEEYGPVIDKQREIIQSARDKQDIPNPPNSPCKLQSSVCKNPEVEKKALNANDFKPLKDEFVRCQFSYKGDAVKHTDRTENNDLRREFGAGEEGC